MKQPFFSICIPVYNMAGTIGLSVESVLRQTCDDWELVIVDDCSTDGTWELLCQKYSNHSKISLHRNEKNLKQWGNLNRCIQLAIGEWIGFLPADDTYRLHALETVKREVSLDESVILWMHAHLCHGEGVVTNIVPVFNHITKFMSDELAEILYLQGNIFGELSSFFISKKNINICFRDCLGAPDLDFYVRLLRANPQGQCVYWPDALALVLQHPNSISSTETKSGRVYAMVLDSIGELGALGWRYPIVLRQYLRAMAFFLRRYARIPGRRWSLLTQNLRSIKVLRENPLKTAK